jgi:hypothetical protein
MSRQPFDMEFTSQKLAEEATHDSHQFKRQIF